MKENNQMFGYGKAKRYEYFPTDWITPEENRWDKRSIRKAWIRRYIFRKKAIFWMAKKKK